MTQPLILYHSACFDGFCAAWLFHQAFPEAELIAVQYGQAAPNVKGRTVYIVDFCYPLDVLIQIAENAFSLTILDHHKTAQSDLISLRNWASWSEEGPRIVFDLGKSGARLAWEFLYHSDLLTGKLEHFYSRYDLAHAPWLVDYTEDRDLWRWQLPHSKEINAALRSYPFDFALWDELYKEEPTQRLLQEGEAILRAEKQMVDFHVGLAKPVTLAGHEGLAVNATVLFSEIGHELAKKASFGATYLIRADGKKLWSLRSTEAGVDVSEIARGLGGGGHKHAAGFVGD